MGIGGERSIAVATALFEPKSYIAQAANPRTRKFTFIRNCLSCDQPFRCIDRKLDHICPKCERKNRRMDGRDRSIVDPSEYGLEMLQRYSAEPTPSELDGCSYES